MNEILQANIFFVIASVATIAFAILVCIAMYYVIKILASIRSILNRVEEGSDMIAEDITTVRNFVVKGGLISHLMSMFVHKGEKKPPKKHPKKSIIIRNEEV